MLQSCVICAGINIAIIFAIWTYVHCAAKNETFAPYPVMTIPEHYKVLECHGPFHALRQRDSARLPVFGPVGRKNRIL